LLRSLYRDYLGFTQSLQVRYGDVVAMRIGNERTLDLFHPDDVRTALVDHADHLMRWERGVAVFSQTFGQGLLVAEGEAWRRQRRMLAPSFGPKRVQGLARLMVQATRQALDAVQPDRWPDGTWPMDELFNALSMDIIMRALFSSTAQGQAAAAAQATQVLSRQAMQEMFWPMSLPDALPLPHKRAKRHANGVLRGLIREQIRARLANPADARPGDDFLALLLAARDDDGSSLSEAEVQDQCLVMFQAGHETTATALLWWSWLVAGHATVAQRLYQEVDSQLQGREPGAEDVPAMPYLTATLKEAMRLYPPVAAVMTRRVMRPFTLRGQLVPAGTMLRISPWVIHHDARWFPQPDRFWPQRFLGEPAPDLPRNAWMPFGLGPRVCIGQNLAWLEMSLVAALLLQRFQLVPAADAAAPRARLQVTLRPDAPLRLRLVPRPQP
jgi:cytochrome P450